MYIGRCADQMILAVFVSDLDRKGNWLYSNTFRDSTLTLLYLFLNLLLTLAVVLRSTLLAVSELPSVRHTVEARYSGGTAYNELRTICSRRSASKKIREASTLMRPITVWITN